MGIAYDHIMTTLQMVNYQNAVLDTGEMFRVEILPTITKETKQEHFNLYVQRLGHGGGLISSACGSTLEAASDTLIHSDAWKNWVEEAREKVQAKVSEAERVQEEQTARLTARVQALRALPGIQVLPERQLLLEAPPRTRYDHLREDP